MPFKRLLVNLTSSRRVLLAIKTAYTTAITLILVANDSIRWAGEYTYVAALIANSASVYTFGEWQVLTWGILYSTIIAAFMSSISSLVYNQKSLLLILLFIGLIWINRNSLWTPKAKAFGCISYLLGTVFPILTNGDFIGMKCFIAVIGIILIPVGVTGFTLLFPYTSLALPEFAKTAITISEDMTKLFAIITKSFQSKDFSDLYIAEANLLYKKIQTKIKYLQTLSPAAEAEVQLFTGYYTRFKLSKKFIALNLELSVAFKGLIGISNVLYSNDRIQDLYAKELNEPLVLINEKIASIYGTLIKIFSSNETQTGYKEELQEVNISFTDIINTLFTRYKEGRHQYMLTIDKRDYHVADNAPIGAFIFHTLRVVELVQQFESMFVSEDVNNQDNCTDKDRSLTQETPKSYLLDIWSSMETCINYVYGTGSYVQSIFCEMPPDTPPEHIFDIRKYIQPIKIASCITIASLLVVIDSLRQSADNGLWASTVIALIRQDNSGSSALMGFQRMQGTLIGSVAAFTIFQVLSCNSGDSDKSTCSPYYITPILTVWNFICALYKENEYGYAATVAGFTPNFLLLGPLLQSLSSAWERVEMTFVGILFYLTVDNLFFPARSDYSLRNSIITSIGLMQSIVEEFCSSIEGEILSQKDRNRSILAGKDSDDRVSMVNDLNNDMGTDIEADKLYQLTTQFSEEVKSQETHLSLAAFEPELWYHPYQREEYENIHNSLENLSEISVRLYLSLRALIETAIHQKDSVERILSSKIPSKIDSEKTKFLFVHIVEVSNIAIEGIKEALEVTSMQFNTINCNEDFTKVAPKDHVEVSDKEDYEQNVDVGRVVLEMDMFNAETTTSSSHDYNQSFMDSGNGTIKREIKINQLLLLSTSVKNICEQADEKYSLYINHLVAENDDVDIEYVMRIQNVYESILQLVSILSDLGRLLFIVLHRANDM